MSAFNRIGIVAKNEDERLAPTISAIRQELDNHQVTYLLDESLQLAGVTTDPVIARDELIDRCDLIIVVGGDGTFLHAARTVAGRNVPLLGVNVGRLGFLVDVSPADVGTELSAILGGHYHEEQRAMLYGEVLRDGRCIASSLAFNDIVLHNRETVRMLEFETYINSQYVSRQRADGLIISTPTGSTAYALSGGGPILHPELNALALVPICPHTLTNRPIVVSASSEIALQLSEGSPGGAQISFDAQVNVDLEHGDVVKITRHPKLLRLIHPDSYNYYNILRKKLRWNEQP